jgi:hypothetical protein
MRSTDGGYSVRDGPLRGPETLRHVNSNLHALGLTILIPGTLGQSGKPEVAVGLLIPQCGFMAVGGLIRRLLGRGYSGGAGFIWSVDPGASIDQGRVRVKIRAGLVPGTVATRVP